MTYDADARDLAIKAIGTVESSLDYTAINYADPITIGVMQWYGTRAAAIIGRMRTENPTSWVGIPDTLTNDLDSHPSNEAWWNDRYLTRAEGEPLREVLNLNRAIQNDQSIQDFEGYKNSAVALGIDPDANTPMMLLFFSALHQSPARAKRLIASIGPSSDIDRLLAALLNEEVFGRYRTRYNTVYQIVMSGDSSGVDPTPDPELPDPGPGADSGGVGLIRTAGDIQYIRKVGDALHIFLAKGAVIIANPTQADVYVTSEDATAGAPVPPQPSNPDPEVPPDPGGSNDVVRAALVAFVVERLGRYDYSQGGTRMEPDRNNYTDCSGLTHYAYQMVAGVEIGSYTVAQLGQGTEIVRGSGNIDESKLKLGDLILYNWRGGRDSVDHVEMYTGPNRVTGHGGPGKGPTHKTLQGMANNAINWYVKRYV